MAQKRILECIGFGVMLTKNGVDYVEDMTIYQNIRCFFMSRFPSDCDDVWLQQIEMGS